MAEVCRSSKCSFDLRLKALNPSHFMNSVCKTVPVSASMRISVVHIRKLCNYFFIFYPSKQKHQASKKLFFVLSHYFDQFQISKPAHRSEMHLLGSVQLLATMRSIKSNLFFFQCHFICKCG